jgi:hypothetical protein
MPGGMDLGKADMISLALTPLSVPVSLERREQGGVAILTSAVSWEDYLGTPAPVEVDFDRQWVALFGSGLKNTGGYSAEFLAIHSLRDNEGLVVETRATSPGFDCVVTQAFTTPHSVVAFDIPAPVPTWAVHESAEEMMSCTPSIDELRARLAASRTRWNQMKADAGNSYTYSQVSSSWVGLWMETTFHVIHGRVLQRDFESTFRDAPLDSWTEIGNEVGRNEQGHAVALLDDMYDQCERDVLTQSEGDNTFVLLFDDAGLLRTCQHWPNGCADDCGRGPRIGFVRVD